ncbi:30S ribosomal protein S1 [Tumebacillus permanentifrigoris]|uniref:Small subunit ribosomal protein S1 n=1 Tax=Tumebacillus permanentifrigoris TaxID=378543 RepID=A0A316DBD1_9BACL|nr:30S ribosomal protein S1 [Tumebacillus permanentifrigoris]PWK14290.1 small subunit ribosomal protein S1 [Tumebacillus permanentifrigoris]
MIEEMKDLDLNTLQKGDIVKGKITKIEDGQALVDVGYKYDGVIPIGELSVLRVDNVSDVVQVGEELELKVMRLNDEEGKMILSKKAVDSVKSWDELERKYEQGEVLEVKVADVVKGGLVIDLGVRGFIPASLVERHFVEDFSDYKGRTLRVKIVEFDRNESKVILSAKAVLDEAFESQKEGRMSAIQPGQVLTGTVQRLTNFGAFVDLGGVDGLVHISEMAHHRVNTPADVVKEGDTVQVKVLKVDPSAGRVSLSIKAASPGPWANIGAKFNAGDIVTGTVKRLVSFGAFVELLPGVEGLVHISQVANRHVATVDEVLEVGQEVKVKILDVVEGEQRISLSIREVDGDNERRDVEKYTKRSNNRQPMNYSSNDEGGSGLGTLGDVFGDLFKK